jgi:EAL domain
MTLRFSLRWRPSSGLPEPLRCRPDRRQRPWIGRCRSPTSRENHAEAPDRVWVNISAPELGTRGLLHTILRALEDTGLSPHQLGLELTEPPSSTKVKPRWQRSTRSRSAGWRSRIDDFGTGYSSLAHLHRFAFDQVNPLKPPGSLASRVEPRRVVELSVPRGGLPDARLGSAGPPGEPRRLFARLKRARRGRARFGGPNTRVRGHRVCIRAALSLGSRRDEPGLVGCDHGLGAVVRADLREDSLHVRLDRLEAHVQRGRDLTVRQAARNEHQHLALTRR